MTRISVNRSDGEGSSDQPATFEILEATVNTTRTVEEKPVDVELTVTNTGDRSGNYTALLRANGNSIGEQQLTVDGRGTESVTLTERFNESGEYRLTLDETTVGTVVVEEPAAFEVTNATVPADFVAPGEPTTAEFEVRNPGNWTGTQVITITADGEQIAQERLTLGPGESEAVVTEFRGTAGEIAIGGTEAGTIEAIQESEPGESESDGDDSSSSIPTLPIVLLLVIAVGVAGIYFVDHGR